MQCVLKKNEETAHVKDTRGSIRPKKTVEDEKYLKVLTFRNRKKNPACPTWERVWKIHQLKVQKYLLFFKQYMAVNKPFVKRGNNFTFQYDIDPKHTATQVEPYSEKHTQWQTISHELPSSEPKPLYSWSSEGSIWHRTEETLANFQTLFLPHMQHFHVCLQMLMSKNLCTYFVFSKQRMTKWEVAQAICILL